MAFQAGLQMVLFHLQIELWPWNYRIHSHDVDVCRFQFIVQPAAHRVDGCWLYVHLLWPILWCAGPRFE